MSIGNTAGGKNGLFDKASLFDSCVNLADKRFDSDRAEVLSRARAAGVGAMLLTASDLASAKAVAAICAAESSADLQLYATCGVHPHNAMHCKPSWQQELQQLAQGEAVHAIGETGLDFFRNLSPVAIQEEVFRKQLQIAIEIDKPVLLHERDASAAFVKILDEFAGELPPCLVHCFTGDRAALDQYLDRGCYIGVTGWICDPERGRRLRGLLQHIPQDKLILETDAPYLTPKILQPKPKGGRNEPMYLVDITRYCAQLLQCPEDELIANTNRNARAFLKL